MTTVFFVRHAQPLFDFADDRGRPLSEEGICDAQTAADFMENEHIDAVLSSPYKRAYDTVHPFAQRRSLPITTDERFREREAGSWKGNNFLDYIRSQWEDHSFRIENGESIADVQARNTAALTEALRKYSGKTLMIGSHGTALSTVLNHYDKGFGFDGFMRIIDFMPYIVKLEFDGERFIHMEETFHILKPYEQRKQK